MFSRIEMDIGYIEIIKQHAQFFRSKIMMRQSLFGAVQRNECAGFYFLECLRLVLKTGNRNKDKSVLFQDAGYLRDDILYGSEIRMMNNLHRDDGIKEGVVIR